MACDLAPDCVRQVVARGEPDFRGLLAPPNTSEAAAREHTIAYTNILDQDVANAVIRERAFSACQLPSAAFVGFCSWAWGYKRGNRSFFDALRPCELVSYHAHCIISVKDKLASMRRMLDKTAHCVGDGGRAASGGGSGGGVLGMWGPREPPVGRKRPPVQQKRGRRKP